MDLGSDPAELLSSCDWGMYKSTPVLLSLQDCSSLSTVLDQVPPFGFLEFLRHSGRMPAFQSSLFSA